jgi:NAD(P)-dependent dehydrogenase (short-subunit alcohol dehydrogenase family)
MTPTSDLSEMTTIVVGASRGLGRGITTAFAEAGAPVIAVARSQAALAERAGGAGRIRSEVADAADPTVTGSLLDRYEPQAVVLVAGASPLLRPLQRHTWRRSRSTGIRTSGSCSTGCARPCSSRSGLAAG